MNEKNNETPLVYIHEYIDVNENIKNKQIENQKKAQINEPRLLNETVNVESI